MSNVVATATMQLTRLRGHFRSYSEGVQHGNASVVLARVSAYPIERFV
jgi:hypothetical protein